MIEIFKFSQTLFFLIINVLTLLTIWKINLQIDVKFKILDSELQIINKRLEFLEDEHIK